jgi:putative heme-binding domain-containing protein
MHEISEARIIPFARCVRIALAALVWIAVVASRVALPNIASAQSDRQSTEGGIDVDAVVSLLELVIDPDTGDVDSARKCLGVLAQRVQSGELSAEQLAALRPRLDALLSPVLAGKPDAPLYLDAALLASSWKNPTALSAVRKIVASTKVEESRRLAAFAALVAARDDEVLVVVRDVLADAKRNTASFRGAVLQAIGRMDDARVADAVLAAYGQLESDLQPKAIELLTQRPAWAKAMLAAIGEGRLAASAVNANQIRQLLASGDAELVAAVKAKWGSIREDRDPKRDLVIAEMRRLIRREPGDPHKGAAVFGRVCGQCHKLYGEGAEVGPDLTSNGRSSFEQILSNVFDPSLVIGAAYQAVNVRMLDGRVLTGLAVEDSDQRLVLKVQGGKTETLARDDIDEVVASKLSMMPEGLETQLKPDEIRDLFALLTLDRSPDDPQARQLPGVREPLPRASADPAQFASIVGEIAPGFAIDAAGEGGVALLAEHAGRLGVVRTHPVSRDKSCVLRRAIDVPADKRTRLEIDVSHDPRGDWRLVVRVDGRPHSEFDVGPKTCRGGWQTVSIDLAPHAGKTVTVELANAASGWSYEFAYWGRAEVISD